MEQLLQGVAVIVLLLGLLSLGVWIGVGLIACCVATVAQLVTTVVMEGGTGQRVSLLTCRMDITLQLSAL